MKALLNIVLIALLLAYRSEKLEILESTQNIESIIIGGSESVFPIIKILAENFETENPGKKNYESSYSIRNS